MGNLKSCLTAREPLVQQSPDNTLLSNPTPQIHQTPQPIIASTSEQQPTSELPQKEAISPHSDSIQAQQQLEPSSYDRELLIVHRPRIVKGLDSYVLNFMLPFLAKDDREDIVCQNTPSEKYRALLDSLYRGADDNINKFMKCVACVLPELFKQVVDRVPTPSEMGFYVEATKNELIDCIMKTGHNVDDDDDHDRVHQRIELDLHHVELAMVSDSLEDKLKERAGTDGQLPDRYQEHISAVQRRAKNILPRRILNNNPESVERESQPPIHPQKVLLYGRAGIGKSTLLQWLAYQWACLKWASEFSLIFLIQVRSLSLIDDNISAIELLTVHGLYSLTDSGRRVASSLLENLFTKVIIMVDGLDEISDFHRRFKSGRKVNSITEKAHPLAIVLSVLRGDILQGCTVISASRPFADLNTLSVTKTFEILGLTEDRLQAFVECKHGKDAAKSIMSYLNQNIMLKSICTITFYGGIVSHLLNKGTIFAAADVKTYTRFTAYITKEFMSRKCQHFLLEMSDRFSKLFSKLSEMAYSGIFELENKMSKIVFKYSDLQKYQISPDAIKFLVKCGIINSYRGKKPESLIVEFVHLSVQEFLAAAHLVSSPTVPDDILDSLFSSGQFNMTLLFVFGFVFDSDTDDTPIKPMYRAVNPSGKVDDSVRYKIEKALINMCDDELSNETKFKLCQVVHEAQSATLAGRVAPRIVSEGKLVIDDTPMTLLDLASVGFVCQFTQQPLVRVYLVAVNADDDFVELFVTTIFDRHKHSITVLDLSYNKIGDEGAARLCQSVTDSGSITVLGLSSNKIGDEGAARLCQSVTDSGSITDLYLSHNKIGDEGAARLCQSLTDSGSITSLHLSYNNFTDVGEQMLAELRRQNPRVTIYY